MVLARIEYFSTQQDLRTYSPIPWGGITALRLPELALDPEFSAICDELWSRVLSLTQANRPEWVAVFQMVVTCGPDKWLEEFSRRVERCSSGLDLERLVRLLRFRGSRVAFRHPGISKAILKQGKQLCGKDCRAGLYRTVVPESYVLINGKRDPHDDYVEAEAIRAAEAHAEDPVLGPFYRWIVQVEQEERCRHEADHRAAMAALDRGGGASD